MYREKSASACFQKIHRKVGTKYDLNESDTWGVHINLPTNQWVGRYYSRSVVVMLFTHVNICFKEIMNRNILLSIHFHEDKNTIDANSFLLMCCLYMHVCQRNVQWMFKSMTLSLEYEERCFKSLCLPLNSYKDELTYPNLLVVSIN